MSISLLVVQGTHAVALAVDAQNRADLAAISAAQDYLGGKSEEESCARATANAHGFETRCIRRAENFTITLSKAGSVPWILPRIEAEATAGPVSVSLDSLVK
ncbi:MAG: hypothetical protein PUK40_06855 [Actinomycetaceae bacterium]|nr:hypothetical protein [Arcanobacterium sp.]MDD7505640.1 hypothetical protein [Actinomycetaceae bacterium]MDY6143424.1 hypothetical protein [Arcanobacterium sp.]